MRKINLIDVHHSGGPTTETAAQVRRFHTAPPPQGRGWSDIGYHWFIRQDSNGLWLVEAGRPEERAGAHDEGQNAHSIGVCLAGDYSKYPVPPAAWAVLVRVLSDLLRKYNLRVENIETHQENEPKSTPTECAGFSPVKLRAAVQEYLDSQDACPGAENAIGQSTGLYAKV
jgi:N-acetyl-anhydromuramyl-L-alanine amidase AmpD